MGTEARRNGSATARPKIAVIFISDRPERYMELRQSALAGRAVHIWLDGDRQPPSWATGLHGDPTDPSTYGASATMTAEYLLAEEGATIDTRLATALLYGIMTDTKSLMRSASDEDLQMFAYLFPRADHAALRRIQHPSYGTQALRRFGEALQHARVHDGLAYVHLGR